MNRRRALVVRVTVGVMAVALLVVLAALAVPRIGRWRAGADNPKSPADPTGEPAAKGPVELVGDATLRVPPAVIESLGVRTDVIRKVSRGPVLELSGSLAPDTNRLAPIRSRFPGEVVELGEVLDPEAEAPTKFRPIDPGDKVAEGQLLAVVWCKDLGEKKSELVDALSQQKLDTDTLKRLREASAQAGAIPEQSIRLAERSLAADRIAVARAERTLRAWRLTDPEIKAIYQEADQVAERVLKGEKARDLEKEGRWARVEVRAPFEGVILEKNFTKGAIIDTSTNLFMLGDLTKLSAFAYAYEEDLPALRSLPTPTPWTIRLKADPTAREFTGKIREVRPTLDPTMHAALVRGQVDNPEGRLVSGQFITATIQLPPPPDEVEVPITALIEDGSTSIIFVQPDPAKNLFTMLNVAVTRQTRDRAQLKARPAEVEAPRAGVRVVVSGALALQAALVERRAERDAATAARKAPR